jgi:transposase InsO family protein
VTPNEGVRWLLRDNSRATAIAYRRAASTCLGDDRACRRAQSFFSSLKTERTGNKTYRTRDQAKADVFDYIERFYNSKRRHSTIGYLSPMEFERRAGLA